MGAAGHSVCPSSILKQQPLQDGPGGISEWQQDALPLWVDLSEGGAAGQGRRDWFQRSPLAAAGEEWGAGAEGGACRRPT